MANPIRVLHVLGTLNRGGAESRIMDLYRHIDREKVQFDFLVHSKGEDDFSPEVKALGGHIYTVPRFRGYNLAAYELGLRTFFFEHNEFPVIQGHMTSTASIYLPAAKKAYLDNGETAPVTIAHVRSAGTEKGMKGWLTNRLRKDLPDKADLLWSCSLHAADAVYGEEAVREKGMEVIPNAIDTQKYAFDPETRNKRRAKYGFAESDFVIGHVGRFDPVKNQRFLLTCLKAGFPENTKLLFVGKGPEEKRIREACAAEGLANRVVFAGALPGDEVAALYAAMDVFALPSLYEGVPGTVVEAQASGLPCLISDTVTEEVCLTPLVQRLPLEQPDEWQKALFSRKEEARGTEDRAQASKEAGQLLAQKGYDVNELAKTMEQKYLELANGRK